MALGNMNIGVDSEFIPFNLNTVLTPPTDSDEVVMNTGAAGYHRKPLSALWSWIKSKMDDEIITITKSITITTDWQDTGIKGNDIPGFGTYAVQFHGGNPTINIWGDYFSGIMTWYNSETNNNDADEISLHCAGHARNGQLFYLRTLCHDRGGDNLTLQIKGSSAASSADIFTFKFRKLI